MAMATTHDDPSHPAPRPTGPLPAPAPVPAPAPAPARERLIVALDVPSRDLALAMVDDLGDAVSFYKVGLELLMSGDLQEVVRRIGRDKRVFVDLKLPSDIPETVRRAVVATAKLGAKFLTLSHSASAATIEAARRGRGEGATPELLFVPVLSSVDAGDVEWQRQQQGAPGEFRADMVRRATDAARAGVDGFIVSGQEIGVLRQAFPRATLVSPGIRPAGAAQDDHKRSCTPAEAIRLGADFLVVGRPIRDAANRRDAAARIVDEIAGA